MIDGGFVASPINRNRDAEFVKMGMDTTGTQYGCAGFCVAVVRPTESGCAVVPGAQPFQSASARS